MIEVYQTIIEPNRGDCHRASIASIFELDITQVPHFRLYNDKWFDVYHHFLLGLGYEYEGTGHPNSHKLDEQESIDGFYLATVPSKTFEGKTHSVIINQKGMVAHDPNPNRLWFGRNVLMSGELISWDLIDKLEK